MEAHSKPGLDRAALIARNVAAAPPFSSGTLERLAELLAPAATQLARERVRASVAGRRKAPDPDEG